MKIAAKAFVNKAPIPKKHTGEGEDISPELVISDVPTGAKSLTLIVDDPDAPMGTWDHWVAWNIPANMTLLPEGFSPPKQGENGWGESNYRGPFPPPGAPHRYFFKLYALDVMLSLPEGASKEDVQKAMEGHTLARTELVGTYQRTK